MASLGAESDGQLVVVMTDAEVDRIFSGNGSPEQTDRIQRLLHNIHQYATTPGSGSNDDAILIKSRLRVRFADVLNNPLELRNVIRDFKYRLVQQALLQERERISIKELFTLNCSMIAVSEFIREMAPTNERGLRAAALTSQSAPIGAPRVGNANNPRQLAQNQMARTARQLELVQVADSIQKRETAALVRQRKGNFIVGLVDRFRESVTTAIFGAPYQTTRPELFQPYTGAPLNQLEGRVTNDIHKWPQEWPRLVQITSGRAQLYLETIDADGVGVKLENECIARCVAFCTELGVSKTISDAFPNTKPSTSSLKTLIATERYAELADRSLAEAKLVATEQYVLDSRYALSAGYNTLASAQSNLLQAERDGNRVTHRPEYAKADAELRDIARILLQEFQDGPPAAGAENANSARAKQSDEMSIIHARFQKALRLLSTGVLTGITTQSGRIRNKMTTVLAEVMLLKMFDENRKLPERDAGIDAIPLERSMRSLREFVQENNRVSLYEIRPTNSVGVALLGTNVTSAIRTTLVCMASSLTRWLPSRPRIYRAGAQACLLEADRTLRVEFHNPNQTSALGKHPRNSNKSPVQQAFGVSTLEPVDQAVAKDAAEVDALVRKEREDLLTMLEKELAEPATVATIFPPAQAPLTPTVAETKNAGEPLFGFGPNEGVGEEKSSESPDPFVFVPQTKNAAVGANLSGVGSNSSEENFGEIEPLNINEDEEEESEEEEEEKPAKQPTKKRSQSREPTASRNKSRSRRGGGDDENLTLVTEMIKNIDGYIIDNPDLKDPLISVQKELEKYKAYFESNPIDHKYDMYKSGVSLRMNMDLAHLQLGDTYVEMDIGKILNEYKIYDFPIEWENLTKDIPQNVDELSVSKNKPKNNSGTQNNKNPMQGGYKNKTKRHNTHRRKAKTHKIKRTQRRKTRR
jgi:hypothetical protein